MPVSPSPLASALIAHFALGDGPQVWGWAAGTGLLWGLSYFFWRRLQATAARAETRPPSGGTMLSA